MAVLKGSHITITIFAVGFGFRILKSKFLSTWYWKTSFAPETLIMLPYNYQFKRYQKLPFGLTSHKYFYNISNKNVRFILKLFYNLKLLYTNKHVKLQWPHSLSIKLPLSVFVAHLSGFTLINQLNKKARPFLIEWDRCALL